MNEDPIQRLIKNLKAEIEQLKEQLRSGGIPLPTSDSTAGDSTQGKDPANGGDLGQKALAAAVAKKEQEMMLTLKRELERKEILWKEKEANTIKLLAKRATSSIVPHRVITTYSANKTTTPRSHPLTWQNHPQAKPFLTALSSDPSLTRNLRLFVDSGLRIGRRDACLPQDLEIDGIGIAAETCCVWCFPEGKTCERGEDEDVDASPYVFEVSASSSESIVFVNGRRLPFISSNNDQEPNASIRGRIGRQGAIRYAALSGLICQLFIAC